MAIYSISETKCYRGLKQPEKKKKKKEKNTKTINTTQFRKAQLSIVPKTSGRLHESLDSRTGRQ